MSFESLHIWDWMAMGVLGLLFIAQVVWYARYLAAPARRLRRDAKSPMPQDSSPSSPGVSVIIAARNEGINLSDYLQALLTQDYPTYEVIVVDDGSEDNTREVIEQYMTHDSRLRTTFVPRDARVRSTKKLALTLGAKGAKYDYLLLTDADCVPASNQWIKQMMQGFGEGGRPKDIVLGFGAYFCEKGVINRIVRYDTLFNGLHYLGAALCGHPYMGVGRNLAYRKELFFESGGFTHLMDTRAGDDDLFVNHLATKQNTAVVLSPDAYTWSTAKHTLKEWWQQKHRHVSVSPAYKQETKWRLCFEPMTRGLFYALVIMMVVYYRPSSFTMWHIPFLVATGLFLVRWTMQSLIINISARRMGLHRFHPGSILWFDIILPLLTLILLSLPLPKQKW